MARKKRSRRRIQQPDTKQLRRVRRLKKIALKPDLTVVEDLRTYHPDGYLRDYKRLTGQDAEIIEGNERNIKKSTIGHKYFKDPREVMVCKRRRERRENLFRLRKIGKGKSVSKKRIRTFKSDIRCK